MSKTKTETAKTETAANGAVVPSADLFPIADAGKPDATPADDGKVKNSGKVTQPTGPFHSDPKELYSGWEPTRTELVPVKDLTFHRALQMRATGSQTFNEATVTEYADHLKDAGPENFRFKALKAVRVSDDEKKKYKLGGNILIWDGFQTGEAVRRVHGANYSVPVQIAYGDYQTARLLALQANKSHGQHRTDADKRRAFYELIDDKELMKLVQDRARDKIGKDGWGGLNRALAEAVGISKGSVSNYLKDRGLAIRADKIINAPKPKDEPAAADSDGKPDGTVGGADIKTPTVSDQVAPSASFADMGTTELFMQMERLVVGIERRLESLADRKDQTGFQLLSEYATAYRLPITRGEAVPVQAPGQPAAMQPGPVRWEILNMIGKAIEEARMKYAANTAQTETAKPAANPAPAAGVNLTAQNAPPAVQPSATPPAAPVTEPQTDKPAEPKPAANPPAQPASPPPAPAPVPPTPSDPKSNPKPSGKGK